MKNIILVTFFFFIGLSCQEKKKENNNPEVNSTVYYFMRHAEKDRTDLSNKDPELLEIGIERAKKWAIHFESIHLDQIYSTDYKRTQQTAKYIAENKNIVVQSYDPRSLYDSEFKKNTKGKKVLVVGHSNTTPAFVNTILGKDEYQDIQDNNNGNLYIVRIEGNQISASLEVYN